MKKHIAILKDGGIGVMPTDTLYGIVASALLPEAVERVYRARKRSPLKPCIILIADMEEVRKFGVELAEETRNILAKLWPGKISIVLPAPGEAFAYLHRGTGTLSFRVPADEELRDFLRETGPLIAPSANTEGDSPAATIEQAKKYFGDRADFYEDAGFLMGSPSSLLELKNGEINILREGAVKEEEIKRILAKFF